MPVQLGDADDRHQVAVGHVVEHRHEREDQHQRRNAHHDFDQAAEQHVDPAAEVAGQRADGDADRGGDAHRDEADAERDLRAVDHLGEDVEALLIGAEPVVAAGLAVGARRVAGLAGPFAVAHAAVRILIDERPDGPTLGILLLQVRRDRRRGSDR